jgi:hypothetical protein
VLVLWVVLLQWVLALVLVQEPLVPLVLLGLGALLQLLG